jgi:hypothetical protein
MGRSVSLKAAVGAVLFSAVACYVVGSKSRPAPVPTESLAPGTPIVVVRPTGETVGNVSSAGGAFHVTEKTTLRVLKKRGEAALPPAGVVPWYVTVGGIDYAAVPAD